MRSFALLPFQHEAWTVLSHAGTDRPVAPVEGLGAAEGAVAGAAPDEPACGAVEGLSAVFFLKPNAERMASRSFDHFMCVVRRHPAAGVPSRDAIGLWFV